MKQITGLEIAAILRSMYSSGKKPHQIAFLLLLHYKKDLSVAEFTYFMGDLKNSSGKLLTRSMVYSYLYALEKQHYVQKEKMISEEGASCNLYSLTPKGYGLVLPIIELTDNWDTVRSSSTIVSLFSTVNSTASSNTTH